MSYCCVPGCKSKSGCSKDISFHEFPADIDLQQKWLEVIHRKDWIPNTSSNSSRICSRHFISTDFKPHGTSKRLVKHAVPSLFEGLLSFPQPQTKKIRLSTSILEKAIVSSSSFSSAVDKNMNTMNIEKVPDRSVRFSKTLVKCEKGNVLSKGRNDQLNEKNITINHHLDRICVMQQEIDKCRKELMDFKNNDCISAFLKILQEAEDGDTSATFLLDLVKNFSNERCSYADSTIQNCVMWHASSPVGYEYARRNLKLKLPPHTVLKKYLSEMN